MDFLEQGGLRYMPTRELLSPAQRAQFLSLPAEMNEQILARYYTLSPEDLARIRRHRRSHNKLGFAVQLAYLRFGGANLDGERRGFAPGRLLHRQSAQGQSDGDCAVCF